MKKLIALIILVILFPLFLGCSDKGNITQLKNLKEQEIFDQLESRYYVFFYKENCTGCETVKPAVLYYKALTKTNNNILNIYGVNLGNNKNKEMYTEYYGENGQGTSGTFYVNNVTNWEELMIGSTPALIRIYEKNGVKTAVYIAQGAKKVEEALQKEAGDSWIYE